MHALLLEAQDVDDVQLRQDRVEVVGDVDGPARQRRRQQGRRGDQGDRRPEAGEGQHVGSGHPAVADVADDGDAQPVRAAGRRRAGGAALLALLADGVAVEQGLGRDARASRHRH